MLNFFYRNSMSTWIRINLQPEVLKATCQFSYKILHQTANHQTANILQREVLKAMCQFSSIILLQLETGNNQSTNILQLEVLKAMCQFSSKILRQPKIENHQTANIVQLEVEANFTVKFHFNSKQEITSLQIFYS